MSSEEVVPVGDVLDVFERYEEGGVGLWPGVVQLHHRTKLKLTQGQRLSRTKK